MNEYHLKNGKRFRDFQENKLGEQYHKKDGISTIVKYKILELIGIDYILNKYGQIMSLKINPYLEVTECLPGCSEGSC